MLTEERNSILQKDFEYVCRTYFPTWDDGNNWSVKLGDSETSEESRHDLKNKIITIGRFYDDRVKRHYLLIHEICHALTNYLEIFGVHDEDWQEEMIKVANIAIKSGQTELYEKIIDEVNLYKNTKKSSPEEIYQRIEDIVRDTAPNVASFYDIVEYSKQYYEMSEEDLTNQFPECRKRYNEAVSTYCKSV
jgi:putative protein kinase ArgK-like GTPase of G3E family